MRDRGRKARDLSAAMAAITLNRLGLIESRFASEPFTRFEEALL
jgi:hypothetical protein